MKDQDFRISKSVRSAFRLFLYYYFNNTLGLVTGVSELVNKNYTKKLVEIPSNAETMIAIFSNNLSLDENGKVLNFDSASKRAAQFIALSIAKPNEPYVVHPPFADWEIELH